MLLLTPTCCCFFSTVHLGDDLLLRRIRKW